MKNKNIPAFLALAFALSVPVLHAKEKVPVQIAEVNYKGEILPVYDVKSVSPTSTASPKYPQQERDQGISGNAVIVAFVDQDGKVLEAAVKSSQPSAAFGVAAQKAMLQWRFATIPHNGKPCGFIVQIPFVFTRQ